jgi:hypothetical protein
MLTGFEESTFQFGVIFPLKPLFMVDLLAALRHV